jgi:NADH-quinone oxidoreductase subunit G
LLIGSNPRWEAPLVNTRIRKAIKAGARVFHIGERSISPIRSPASGTISRCSAICRAKSGEAFEGQTGTAVIVGMGALVHEGAFEAAHAVATLWAPPSTCSTRPPRGSGALELRFTTEAESTRSGRGQGS